jgi:hypothetical protein
MPNTDSGSMGQQAPLKCWYPIASLHGVTTHKTMTWTRRFIIHAVDLVVTNGWTEYRNDFHLVDVPKMPLDPLDSRTRIAVGS